MLTPMVQCSANGADISGKLAGRVISWQITEHDSDHADELHIVLSNFDGRLAKPSRGATLDVACGFEETGIQKSGSFKVMSVAKVGAPATFEVTGHAADLSTTLKQQKTRSWVNQPLSAALNQIAGDNGLSPAIAGDLGAIVDHWYQAGESDMHFVTRLARRFGAVAKVAEGKLIFLKRGTGETASGGAMGGITVTPNDLEGNFKIEDHDRPDHKNVKGKVYDRTKGSRTEVSQAGAGNGPDYTYPHIFGNKAHAQASVTGRKREFDRAQKTFSGTFRTGQNQIKAGGVLTTSGFGDDDDTDWTVERCTHSGDASGYVTGFECKVKVA